MAHFTKALAVITGVGQSTDIDTQGCIHHTFQVVADNRDNTIVFRLIGSADGTNYGLMPVTTTASAGLAISNNVITLSTITSGVATAYLVQAIGATKFLAVDVVTNAGATATLTATYMGTR